MSITIEHCNEIERIVGGEIDQNEINQLLSTGVSFKSIFEILAEDIGFKQDSAYWSYANYPCQKVRTGFKIHVPFDGSSAEELIGALSLLKDLKKLQINAKISLGELPGTQNGKDICIYAKRISDLSQLSAKAKCFILSTSKKKIKGEYCFKTFDGESRLFIRYCHFNDGDVFDFGKGEYLIAERGSNPLPSFLDVNNVVLLDYLLDGQSSPEIYALSKKLNLAETIEDVANIINPLIASWCRKDPKYANAIFYVKSDALHQFLTMDAYVSPY